MNSLSENADKLHTTEAGAQRIKRSLNLETEDVVSWCREAVCSADIIIRQGKNWYVYKGGSVITVNAGSFTVITAHKINAKVREMQEPDYACLPEFLYQAVFVPEGTAPPPRSIINDPKIFVYIRDFGKQKGDLGIAAEQDGQIIGAAWTRIIPAYGHIDNETPELAVSVLPEFRGYGTGTKLMKKLFGVLRREGFRRTSLSVHKENPAVRFYQRLGYEISDIESADEYRTDCIMIKELLKN